MHIKLLCSECEKPLRVRSELAGRKCRCPYCKATVVVPDSDSTVLSGAGVPSIDTGKSDSTGVSARTQRSGRSSTRGSQGTSGIRASSDGSSVSLVTSGAIAGGATITLFLLLYPLKASGIRLGAMFWDSIGINFPTTLLMFWSFAILVLKSRQLSVQRSAMLMDLLPNTISQEITLDSLDQFVSHIRTLPEKARQSIIVNRVLRGIEHFRVRKSAAETVTMMESQSGIDAANVASSYAIIKVFIWAMPILGFIGTVMGVSSAVSGLSATLENASDVSAVTESMKGVFGGLGTAFDTTLIALVMSMIVKIPTSALQRAEDAVVTIADEYCNETLLRRLNDGREGGAERGSHAKGGAFDQGAFQQALELALGSKEVAAYHKQCALHTQQMNEQLRQMVQVNAEIQDMLGNVSAGLKSQFTGVEKSITGLNEVLTKLGEKQVVIQQVKKRGWFGKSKPSRRR